MESGRGSGAQGKAPHVPADRIPHQYPRPGGAVDVDDLIGNDVAAQEPVGRWVVRQSLDRAEPQRADCGRPTSCHVNRH